MNDAQLLERLTDAYAALPAPTPSTELAARMDAGWIGDLDDDRRDAVVVPLVRPRARFRYLVAALVASFVAVSGLAAAGALPDALQRQVSSVVSHLGIHLPSPDSSSHDNGRAPSDGSHSSTGPSSKATQTSGVGAAGDHSSSTTAPSLTPAPGDLSLGGLGDVGGVVGSTGTSLPPTGDGGDTSVTLPPVTLPPVGVPGVTVPGLSLPPVTLPPVSLPPVTVPPVTLPPIL
jgi:hypothetical protein